MAYSRGVSLTQIYPAPGADADTDIDIIAIHGLDTKSPDTWTSKSNYPNEDVNWLACPYMLPERIGPARIFTCDWPADLFEQPDLIQKTAEEFARLLLAGIKRRPLPTQTGYAKRKDRPIVFIASCLGGIILIKALVIASHSSEYAIIRQSTRGIVFLATPFRGTSFQDVADWAEPGLRAWASIRGQKVGNLINDVKGSTFSLEELVRKFTQLCYDKDYPCQVVTFYETGLTSFHRKFPVSWLIPSGVFDHLVPPKPLVDSSSATLDIVTDPLPLNRRHVMMNKFNGPEDPDYQCVVGKIEEILQNIRRNSPLEDADAWIRSKHYTMDRLKIERLSGDRLPMDQCYINLAVVEQLSQNSGRTSTENVKSFPFSLFDRQKIEVPGTTVRIELATFFSQRRHNGETIQPRRILVRGRAGVGKTTLCKKIVHEFTQGTWSGWNDLFDRILWVPLRNLKLEERRQHPAYDFEALFTHEYFSLPNNKPDFAKHLARSLEINSSKTLFLLDGLDEVSQELAGDNSMSRFLNELLEQPNIIVTSRPSGRLPLNFDLELETIGFYPDQVKNYINKAFTNPRTAETDEKTVDKIQAFLQNHWLIQGLVRIPIQLDALCYSWKDIRSDMLETMSALYQAIELSLWKKDIVRLGKIHNHESLTTYHIQDASQQKIEEFIKDEMSFLESLAFAGLLSDTIEFEPKHLNLVSDRFLGFLVEKAASSLSFLRASNPSSEYRNRSYHFIHLTFQEYFAARYFVRQWTAREPLSCVELGSGRINKIEPVKFFQKHKYTSRYDILWRFVAGLLDADSAEVSLFFQRIEEEPLDLLGPAHQRLVMHCLSEVSSDLLVRTNLERRLSDWLIFECEISKYGHSRLAGEVEFPEQALETAFREASDNARKKMLMSIPKRTTAPASIIQQAISWLGHVDNSTQEVIIQTLQRLVLPNEILRVVAAKLEDKDKEVRKDAIQVLAQQSILPEEIFKALAARLNDEDTAVQGLTVLALGGQSFLPDEILKAMATRLDDEDQDVRANTVMTLGEREALPDEILKAIAARLDDEDEHVRANTVMTLGDREALPDEILKAIASRLDDEDQDVRANTVMTLGDREALPDEILKAIAARLDDEYLVVQEAAVMALVGQLFLPNEFLRAIAVRLEDEDWVVRQAARKGLDKLKRLGPPYKRFEDIATQLQTKNWSIRQFALRSLNQQCSLSDEVIEAIKAQLEDSGNSTIQISAMEALSNQSDLPKKIIQAIAAQLKDNENTSVQVAALEALGNQLNLSTEILQVIAAQLKDNENSSVQKVAIETLGKQSNLSKKMLRAIAAQLKDNENSSVQKAAIEALGEQSSLPDEILNAIAAHLEDNSQNIRWAAIRALANQSNLSNEILNAIVAQLKVNNPFIQGMMVHALGNQLRLPDEFLNAIAAFLDDDTYATGAAEKALRKRRESYLTLLKGPYASSFYKVLLKWSFTEELCWCVDGDGDSTINMPGDGERLVIGKQYDIEARVKEIRPTNYPTQ